MPESSRENLPADTPTDETIPASSDTSAEAPLDSQTLPPDLLGVQIDAYVVRGRLGQGGMGTVYRADDTALGREVALKVIRPELAQGPALDRFVREAQAMASLNHPNLLAIHRIGQTETLGGLPYFVMELITGQSLAERLREKRRLPAAEVLRMGEQVLSALECVHAAGITHRDLKPANIMIRNDDGRAVLMDFGIAKVEQAEGLTTEGLVLGTPEYMAPEQAEGHSADARSDIYSFGVMLYEMVTGSVPFRGKSAFSVLRQQVESQPRPPTELSAACSPALEAIILTCLSKNPDDRYQDASELAQALRADARDAGAGDFTRPTAAIGAPDASPTAPTLVEPPGPKTEETVGIGERTDRRGPSDRHGPTQTAGAFTWREALGWFLGIGAAALLVALVLHWGLPGEADPWPKEYIESLEDVQISLPDGSTLKVKLLSIEPTGDGGFAATFSHQGRIKHRRIEPGFEADLRPYRPD